jgi:hypothetical protein
VETSLYSHHWIATGWHGERWDFQNNEKTMEHSQHWIATGWHGEQRDFQNNEKTMDILITGSRLDGMENGGIFKTMKRQWTLFSSLERDWMAWRTVGFLK